MRVDDPTRDIASPSQVPPSGFSRAVSVRWKRPQAQAGSGRHRVAPRRLVLAAAVGASSSTTTSSHAMGNAFVRRMGSASVGKTGVDLRGTGAGRRWCRSGRHEGTARSGFPSRTSRGDVVSVRHPSSSIGETAGRRPHAGRGRDPRRNWSTGRVRRLEPHDELGRRRVRWSRRRRSRPSVDHVHQGGTVIGPHTFPHTKWRNQRCIAEPKRPPRLVTAVQRGSAGAVQGLPRSTGRRRPALIPPDWWGGEEVTKRFVLRPGSRRR